jgi:hypothetical protein
LKETGLARAWPEGLKIFRGFDFSVLGRDSHLWLRFPGTSQTASPFCNLLVINPVMPVPETTSAEGFAPYIGGECVRANRGKVWRDRLGRRNIMRLTWPDERRTNEGG